ncbi:iron-containing alcohol dehydrogenase [Clostridium septicum]|uniref:Alcohol dehydrogenase n=1 Tax=Clostridium septicum TaxID=1504 RepID=A0A9N7PJP1_CLOSE|nr:iron-containing alcohol dehydrogenase [Clostridium septicum]AYE35021.1 alcohol dehydrogenase [Clostridium septicum]MDU1312610.1 iron-containing alcohol dehydrogenase [Clostridium septicum]UEC20329.1 iron-containing alcohol dehydrogenase [Clostridium septicum]USS01619.1 iron-containing alcohol dehydrogenase [Clostridium septicum]WLF70190.1 iron-containing alcohol dehydrogenase [Clostridium septicum]
MAKQFIMPKRIITGKGALEEGKKYLNNFGKKVLIITDKVMVQLGNVKVITDILEEEKIEYVIYSEINSEPTDTMIDNGIKLYQMENCNFLIALGGGSPIDSAKAIAAMITNEGSIADYKGREISNELPPVVAIPTTAGTGSEATQFTIITDTKNDVKMLLKGAALLPVLAIIDPRFTVTSPAKVTAATGLDALTHAIEAYTSRKSQQLSDVFAISAVKRIFKYLPIAFENPKDLKAREEMALAALEAGIAFNNSSVTIVHGMSRPIGALFHIAHGLSNAILLKECFEYVVDGAYDKFAQLAREINVVNNEIEDEVAAEIFIKEIGKLIDILRIPNINELGIDKIKFLNNIEKMAKDAIESGSPSNTRKIIEAKDIINIYNNLWR